METKSVVFESPWKVEFKEKNGNGKGLPAGVAFVQTETSVVSAGTELAILSGNESWAPLPYAPGYGIVGTVRAKGDGLDSVDVGDRAFTFGQHASFSLSNTLIAKVPEGLSSEHAVLARIAQIAMVAERTSETHVGDYVAVLGLGLVGNFAAQLFSIAGCEVIGVDLSSKRRDIATECGVAHVVDGSGDVKEAISDITNGKMCRTVVEATGVPAVACQASEYSAFLGEVILLGSPRGERTEDVTPMLNRIHLWPKGCVTYKGAHEWRMPIDNDPNGHIHYSFQNNVETIFRLMQNGKLAVEPIITHIASPDQAPEVYKGLRENPDEYMGVVFDWRKL
ncbi:MAG: zinc-binding dehydrogenase [Chitinivibrionales bacterium]|nr:zinc-binding dehydrogenase [Chitinivibrionales bacterium]MBD3395999.1 zinc-binding dehydrogenase [Chitinivibrionales bacterium]